MLVEKYTEPFFCVHPTLTQGLSPKHVTCLLSPPLALYILLGLLSGGKPAGLSSDATRG
jgi:hypothetical protein